MNAPKSLEGHEMMHQAELKGLLTTLPCPPITPSLATLQKDPESILRLRRHLPRGFALAGKAVTSSAE